MIITLEIDTFEELQEQDRQILQAILDNSETKRAAPAKKTAAKKTAAKKDAPTEGPDHAALRQTAVEKARDLLDSGPDGKEKVVAVLAEIGAMRVSDIPDESLQTFLDALA